MRRSKLLKEMLEIYSPSGRETQLSTYLLEKMQRAGFHASRDAVGNLIGRIGQGNTRVLLAGHLDTVEGEIPVRIENGKLHGRGSVDAKGSLATFILAASRFQGSKGLEITVAGLVEEESTSRGAYHLVDQLSPDYVVVGEPSGWEGITLGYRGSIQLSFSLELPKAHHGRSCPLPAEEAVSFYQGLKYHLEDGQREGFYATEVRLSGIQMEENPFSNSVFMDLDIRTGPDFSKDNLENFISKSGEVADVSLSRPIPPVKQTKSNRLVSCFLGGIREQGGKPKFKLKTGTADMNIFAQNWKVPIIAYGPGNSSLDHTPEEHLEIKELNLAEKVLRESLNRLHGCVDDPKKERSDHATS